MKSKPRILVIDDEKILAWTMGMLLTKAGYDVATFNNPLLALEEVQRCGADLVISDVVMPELSGIDLAMRLQQVKVDCKVILLSGQANTRHLLSQAQSQGFDFEVFPKPIAPAELLRMVQTCVDPVAARDDRR